MTVSWDAWRLDVYTWCWIVWLLAFVVLETWSLRSGNELTAHLRPLFLSVPVVWWMAFGLWGWIGIHLLAPAWERALLQMVRGL